MNKQKIMFLVFVVVLAAVLFAVSYLIEDKENIVYQPMEYTPQKTETAKQDETVAIKKTQLVYFFADSDVFHIDSGCSGIGTIQGRPCGYAIELGKKPCGICMKNYVIS